MHIVLNADSRAVLATMLENSIDAVVTDPPYELGFMGKAWDKAGVAFDPTFWRLVLRVLKPGGHLLAFGGTRTYHRIACAIEDAGFEIRDSIHWMYGSGFPKSLNGEWGGTALKPGHEPILVARKPLPGTVAANFAAWGTGALNIDGCRLKLAEDEKVHTVQSNPKNRVGEVGTDLGFSDNDANKFRAAQRASIERTNTMGRWPPNVLLDPGAAAALDAQSGPSTSRVGKPRGSKEPGDGWGMTQTGAEYADTGGASRFFPTFDHDAIDEWPFRYVAKAARSEREAGCAALPARTGAEAVEREEGTAGIANPRAGAGRTAKQIRNHHPTVKPVALMRWLVRLVTPPGGRVLDPFTGSGTTGVAAKMEGFDFVGIERETEYATIAEARLAHAIVDTTPRPE